MTQPGTIARPDAVAQPPALFTACVVHPGATVEPGTTRKTFVPLQDGEMTIDQGRGSLSRLTVRHVSDPRLDGTWYETWSNDDYTVKGRLDPSIVRFTDRIENDDGAWQGSAVMFVSSDATISSSSAVQMVMIGEGAYQGLTAILQFEDFPSRCHVDGYIIQGSFPVTSMPQPGQ